MNIEINIESFQQEAGEQHASLLKRCMFLAGRVGALEIELKALNDKLQKADNVVPMKKD